MKTVDEFIHRLQNDPEFEQRAQSYDNSDDFMEFIKGEGYDFTLDQLLDEFNNGQLTIDQKKDEAEELPPHRKTVEDFIRRLHDDREFEHKARAFEDDEAFLEFIKSEGYDFTLDQLMAGFKQMQELLTMEQETPLAAPRIETASKTLIPESSEVKQGAELPPRAQERGGLYPKFEGSIGGRRRGMRWRQIDSKET